MIGSVVRIVLGLVLAIPLLAWLFQERMLFFPRGVEQPPSARSGAEPVTVLASDETKLRGWFLKGSETPGHVVIYFGGNAEEVSWLAGVADQFAGWSLLLVNYRGYGESEGTPGEAELFDDALSVYDYILRRPDVAPESIVAMGRSLGSGVAVHLAANRPVRGVILVSPYDSIVEVAKRHYPLLPVALLLRHRFDSLSEAPAIDAPLLCLVASRDRVIPVAHSQVLFDTWRGVKTWREVPLADHDTIAGEPGYWRAIAEYLRKLRQS